MDKFAQLVATLYYIGYFPIASGTVGSLVTLPFVMVVAYFFGVWGIVFASIVIFLLGLWAVARVTRNADEHDPSYIVIDEALGQCVTFVLVAYTLQGVSPLVMWKIYCAGFILFRFFDAVKLHLARWADSSLHNALGVMLDDFFASLYAAVLLWIFCFFDVI